MYTGTTRSDLLIGLKNIVHQCVTLNYFRRSATVWTVASQSGTLRSQRKSNLTLAQSSWKRFRAVRRLVPSTFLPSITRQAAASTQSTHLGSGSGTKRLCRDETTWQNFGRKSKKFPLPRDKHLDATRRSPWRAPEHAFCRPLSIWCLGTARRSAG